ncbi:MAG: YqaA family protein [Patescibacteria group bacterium UBA2163]
MMQHTDPGNKKTDIDITLYVRDSWEWFRRLAQKKVAVWWLGVYSFFESVILPVPTDIFLALLVLANPRRVPYLVFVAVTTSVIGAAALYVAIIAMYDTVFAPLIAMLGWSEALAHAQIALAGYAFVGVFVGAFSPIPYTPVILAAGILRVDFFVFILASIIGRTLRYGIVATITHMFGIAVLPRLGRIATRTTIVTALMSGVIALAAFNVFLLLRM